MKIKFESLPSKNFDSFYQYPPVAAGPSGKIELHKGFFFLYREVFFCEPFPEQPSEKIHR